MVKKILCLMIAVMLLACLPISAFASVSQGSGVEQGYSGNYQSGAGQTGGYPIQYSSSLPYPIDIQTVNIGGIPYIYKTYSVVEGTDPQTLVEEAFRQAGYQYRHYEIIQQELIPSSSERQETQTVTKQSGSSNTDEVLALFDSSIPYDDSQGYTGTLTLQPQSLVLTEEGRENYSYSLTDTQEFPGISNKDTSPIPKSITKNGVTLSLQNIDWVVTNSENAGYSAIPSAIPPWPTIPAQPAAAG